MTDDMPATPRRLIWPEFKILWQEIDRRVVAGEFSPAQAVQAAREEWPDRLLRSASAARSPGCHGLHS